jgi:hypothetical protein
MSTTKLQAGLSLRLEVQLRARPGLTALAGRGPGLTAPAVRYLGLIRESLLNVKGSGLSWGEPDGTGRPRSFRQGLAPHSALHVLVHRFSLGLLGGSDAPGAST